MATAVIPTTSSGPTAASSPTAKLTFIPDILEEHLAEIAFLFGQWLEAVRSREYTHPQLLELEERIAAHVHGVLVVGDRGLDIVEAGLASDDVLEVFASAFSLLQAGDPDLETRVLVLFARSQGAQLEGLRLALRHGASPAASGRLTMLAQGTPGLLAAAAADVLAFRGLRGIEPHWLQGFLSSEAPRIRESAWRLVAYTIPPLEPATFETGLRDDDEAVRRAALLAAAWCARPEVLSAARQLAAAPALESRDALHLLAVLAPPGDAAAVGALVQSTAPGPEGMRLLGSLGNPASMEAVLRGMENPDPATAVAAGEAFAKMTGVDVTSTRTAQVPVSTGDEDEFDAEFHDLVALPDADLARREWQVMRQRLDAAARIACGLDLGREFTAETFGALDMESRWEACLRGRFYGTWVGSPVWIERYPQSRAPARR